MSPNRRTSEGESPTGGGDPPPVGGRDPLEEEVTATTAGRLGRALLAAGVELLRARGARSVALGVDGGDPIPLALYRSAGFETISTTIILERSVGERSSPEGTSGAGCPSEPSV